MKDLHEDFRTQQDCIVRQQDQIEVLTKQLATAKREVQVLVRAGITATERAERAEAANKRHRDDDMKAHRWFAKMWGEQMNGRDFDMKFSIAEQQIAALTQERDALLRG